MRLRDLTNRVVKPRLNQVFSDLVLTFDDDDFEDLGTSLETDERTLSGLTLILDYEDSRGRRSQRVVTCKQYAVHAGSQYLKAFCHHREALRTFRLDRIVDIFDPKTGESLSPVQEFFAQFAPDRVTRSGLTWGMSVDRRADLIALLNALIFIARCDREYHPAERSSLEHALTAFWLRLELLGNPDFEDILDYADRLAPDGETFWLAMHRFREEPLLADIFIRHAHLLIQADGTVRQEEAYWALEIVDFLSED